MLMRELEEEIKPYHKPIVQCWNCKLYNNQEGKCYNWCEYGEIVDEDCYCGDFQPKEDEDE